MYLLLCVINYLVTKLITILVYTNNVGTIREKRGMYNETDPAINLKNLIKPLYAEMGINWEEEHEQEIELMLENLGKLVTIIITENAPFSSD